MIVLAETNKIISKVHKRQRLSPTPIGNSLFAIYCGGRLCKLTLPTAKAEGFLFLPPLHWQIPYGTAMSYTVSTGYLYTVPACPAVQFSYLYADCSCSPFFKILMPAFVSRS